MRPNDDYVVQHRVYDKTEHNWVGEGATGADICAAIESILLLNRQLERRYDGEGDNATPVLVHGKWKIAHVDADGNPVRRNATTIYPSLYQVATWTGDVLPSDGDLERMKTYLATGTDRPSVSRESARITPLRNAINGYLHMNNRFITLRE